MGYDERAAALEIGRLVDELSALRREHAALVAENDQLTRRVAELTAALEEATRAAARQAAPSGRDCAEDFLRKPHLARPPHLGNPRQPRRHLPAKRRRLPPMANA